METNHFEYGFYGCGNMGSAILSSNLEGENFKKEQVLIKVRQEEAKKKFEDQYGVHSTLSESELENVETLILGVKPQGLDNIDYEASEGQHLVSILAGKKLAELQDKFKTDIVSRVMPNLALQVGDGVSAIIHSEAVNDTQKETVRKIFESGGVVLEVKNEEQIDQVTILSASMQGILGYLQFQALEVFKNVNVSHNMLIWATALIQKMAEDLEFSSEQAEIISSRTLSGLLKLEKETDLSWIQIQEKVTSKNGTTEAMLRDIQKNKVIFNVLSDKETFETVLRSAVDAGLDRAEELGQKQLV